MKTKRLLWLLTGSLAAAGPALAAQGRQTIELAAGFNSVAVHLEAGGNLLDTLFPVMPDGAALYKFDRASQQFFEPAVFVAGFGWVTQAPATAFLKPGEGAFVRVNRAWSVEILGELRAFQPRADVGPGFNFVSCQSLGDCSFAKVFGFGPQPGDRVYLYDQPFGGSLTNIEQNASSVHFFGPAGWDTAPVFRQGRAAMVWLSEAPRIVVPPTNQAVRAGESVTFTVVATGAGPLGFRWRFDGLLLPGATNSALRLTNVQPTNAGGYSVIVSNPFGAVTSAVALLRVLTPPSILQPPASLTVRVGETATFEVKASGSPPLSYLWFHNGVPLAQAVAGEPVLMLPNVSPADAGEYFVTVTNAFGAATSSPATLRVLEPPRILMPPQSVTVASNAPVQLRVVAEGTPPLLYFWRRNGVLIPGATNQSLDLPAVHVADSGSYSVVVQNEAGAVLSPPAALRVELPLLLMDDNFPPAGILTSSSGVGRGSNQNASAQPGEPRHFGKSGGRSVWLTWEAPATGVATFRSVGSGFDTLLAAYSGLELGALEEVAADDDRGGFLTSQIRFNAVAGELYHLVVDGYQGAEGELVLSWELEPSEELLPVIVTHPQSQLTTFSNDVFFTVVARPEPLDYQWFFNDRPLPGGTQPLLPVFNAQPANAGLYFARVFRGSRAVDSRPAVLAFSLADPGEPPATNLVADKFGDALAQSLPTFPQEPAGKRALASAGASSVAAGYAGTQVFSTYGASSEPGEPVHCGVVGGASEWFLWIAPTNGTAYLNTDGSDFDTILAVYTGPGISFETLIPVACDNNSGANGRTSKLQFPCTANTPYYIAVDGVAGATGTVVLNYRLLVPMVLSRVALTGGVFRYRVTATPSHPFTIQRSGNLATWTSVLTTSSSSGTYTFFESNAPAGPRRFYRTRQTP